ncbi:MAG: hypothetical protein DU489_01790 [Nitrosomonas sp.]|uniref:hypothetical protein n=1 Tax=Nitrosomonas sp. TaxID=42353 RepID=UPI0032EAE03D
MSSDSILQLLEPVTDESSIRSVNFFNGRLLTSKDFTREQDARHEADMRLGLALGEGVVFGLQIENDGNPKTDQPVVKVKAGLAINGKGQALRLNGDVHVALTRSFEATSADCLFGSCKDPIGGTYVAGAGAYLLTIAPAEKSEGKAANNGLDPSQIRCNTDTTVETVQFRLIRINPKLYADLDVAASSFRNELAYRCFGAGIQSAWFENLLETTSRPDGLLETLRKTVLSNLEVPLGILFFTGIANLQFIDLWAVRRPLSRIDDALPSLVDGRRLAIGQAMFQQFQTQIALLRQPSSDLGSVTAQSHFRYLPPVGIIPVTEKKDDSDTTDAQATKFFTGLTYRSPVFINAARLEALIRDSLCYPPIDTQSGEMLWLYRVRENHMAINPITGKQKPQSYLVFASGHLPYIGDAQFDLGRYDYANYALAR